MSWTNATNSIIMVFNLLHYKYRENCDWTCFPICGFEAPSFHPPSKSLLPIQVSPNWFWPKGESDLDARYRYISTGKYRHHTTPTHRQIQMCTNIQTQVWGLETCRGEPGTDILTGWLEVRRRPDGPWHWEVCHSLSGKGDRICVFWKSDLSRWKIWFVTTHTRVLVLDDQWISGCSSEEKCF